MTDTLTLALPDGRTSSLIVHPAATRAPAVLVVHEWYGVNADIHAHAARLVEAGFVAAVPDLYFGESTSEPGRAMELSSAMKTATSMEILKAARDALAADPRTTGKVGVTGFCLGGAMAIAAACTVAGIDAAVAFYGTPREEFLHFSPGTPPIQGHYGEHDPIIPTERVRALRDRAVAAGARFDLHVYDAGHAFLRRGDPSAYVAAAAEAAWPRAVAFFRAHLA